MAAVYPFIIINMVVVFLDTDPAKQVKLNPQDFKKMQDMTARLAQSFGLDDI